MSTFCLLSVSEKEGWPRFPASSCAARACTTAIPCCEESKARCCSAGAAISQRKALNFCLLVSGPISNDQPSWSCFYLAVQALFWLGVYSLIFSGAVSLKLASLHPFSLLPFFLLSSPSPSFLPSFSVSLRPLFSLPVQCARHGLSLTQKRTDMSLPTVPHTTEPERKLQCLLVQNRPTPLFYPMR